jgi:thiol-disulfide isomerase/thioredoxin
MAKKFSPKKMIPSISVKHLLRIIGGILFVIVAYMIIKRVFFKEGFQDASTGATLMFFSADWCPHCKKAKPEWEAAKSKMDGTSVNGTNVVFKEVDCTAKPPPKETQDLMKKYGVEGFPTIVLVKGETTKKLEEKPTQESISTFVNANV